MPVVLWRRFREARILPEGRRRTGARSAGCAERKRGMKLGKTAAVLLALGMTLGMQGPGRCQSSDDFNGPALSPAWTFITPSTPGSYLDLTSRPGFLHMVSSDLDAPRLWQAVSGSWALEVRLEFD